MDKKITIEIPDDLNHEQEVLAIAKKLSKQKTIDSKKSNTKLIGDKTVIKNLETSIIIKRVSKEKPIELVICSVCQTQYEKQLGFPYYHNIGGNVKKGLTCSEPCTDIVISISPDRISKKKSKIKQARLHKY